MYEIIFVKSSLELRIGGFGIESVTKIDHFCHFRDAIHSLSKPNGDSSLDRRPNHFKIF